MISDVSLVVPVSHVLNELRQIHVRQGHICCRDVVVFGRAKQVYAEETVV